jgi:hypothetical protein
MRPTQFNLGEFGGGVFAEFETNLRRERQLEGIAKAKAAGVYKGRPPSIDSARVREMKAQGHGPAAIAKRLKIGRASVYRVLSMAQVPNTNKGLLRRICSKSSGAPGKPVSQLSASSLSRPRRQRSAGVPLRRASCH